MLLGLREAVVEHAHPGAELLLDGALRLGHAGDERIAGLVDLGVEQRVDLDEARLERGGALERPAPRCAAVDGGHLLGDHAVDLGEAGRGLLLDDEVGVLLAQLGRPAAAAAPSSATSSACSARTFTSSLTGCVGVDRA